MRWRFESMKRSSASPQASTLAAIEPSCMLLISEHHQHTLRLTVERHGEICRSAASRPSCDLLPRRQIDDCNASRIGNVDISPPCISVELKAFRVRPQRDFGDLAASDGIDDCQRTTAIADDDLLVRLIYAHV